MDRVKRIWYLQPMRAAKVQASLRIRAVSPEPSLLAHISSESRGTFRQKARSLAPLNGWACAVKICHDGMLEDTNSLDGAQIIYFFTPLYMNDLIDFSVFHSMYQLVLPKAVRPRALPESPLFVWFPTEWGNSFCMPIRKRRARYILLAFLSILFTITDCKKNKLYEPYHKKTCIGSVPPVKTKASLLSYRS